MTFAVIKTGGKQYKVSQGDSIKIEKITAKGGSTSGGKIDKKALVEGDKISFDKVLLVDDGKKTQIGVPVVKGAKVDATIEKIGKGKKLNIVRFRAKSRYTKRVGHRQPFFQVKIDKIV
jgi:large subunit ribosomal protein L21